MILGSKILSIVASCALMIKLGGESRGVMFPRVGFFLVGRADLHPARSAVETGRRPIVDDHGAVIDIRHIGDADVGD